MPAAKPLKRLLSSNSVLRRSNTPIKPFNTISPRKLKTEDTDKAESRSVTDYVMLLYTNRLCLTLFSTKILYEIVDRIQSSKNDIYNLCKKVNFHLKYDILYDFIFDSIYILL